MNKNVTFLQLQRYDNNFNWNTLIIFIIFDTMPLSHKLSFYQDMSHNKEEEKSYEINHKASHNVTFYFTLLLGRV